MQNKEDSTLKKWTRFGFQLMAGLYLMEKYMLPDEKIMRPREGLEQPRLNFDENETYDLLDTLTGELKIQGWEINGEKMVNDNSA